MLDFNCSIAVRRYPTNAFRLSRHNSTTLSSVDVGQ